jgi:hypothetical protein
MSDELKDILSNLNEEIGQDKLLDYLNKKLPANEAHEVEKLMTDDLFVSDAVEGLEQFNNKTDLTNYVQQLNQDLRKQLEKKKSRKEKRKLKEQPWVYFTIVLLLIMAVVCYIMIKKYLAAQGIKTGSS